MTQLAKTPQQKIASLKAFLKTTKKPAERDRARAILRLIEGKQRQEVADFFDINVKTIDTWQRKFKKHGVQGLQTAPQAGNNYRLDNVCKNEIKQVLHEKTPKDVGLEGAFWSVSALREYVKREYHVEHKSDEAYRKLFKYCGFSYHKPDKTNRKQNQHLRKQFEIALKKSSKHTSEKAVWYW